MSDNAPRTAAGRDLLRDWRSFGMEYDDDWPGAGERRLLIAIIAIEEEAAAPASPADQRLREAARAVLDSMKEMSAETAVVETRKLMDLIEALAAGTATPPAAGEASDA